MKFLFSLIIVLRANIQNGTKGLNFTIFDFKALTLRSNSEKQQLEVIIKAYNNYTQGELNELRNQLRNSQAQEDDEEVEYDQNATSSYNPNVSSTPWQYFCTNINLNLAQIDRRISQLKYRGREIEGNISSLQTHAE